MLREEIQQLRVHERLATEDAEEGISMFLGIQNGAVQRFQINSIARSLDIHPTTLAAEIAGVQNAQVKERREIRAFLHALLVQHDRASPFKTKIPSDLREAVRGDGGGDAGAKREDHEER